MQLNPSGYGLIPIQDVDQQVVDTFSCGVASLDSFLKCEAKDFHDGRLGHTYCVFHEKIPDMAGFFTMANDRLKMNNSEVMELGVNTTVEVDAIPAILIGKFAVKTELQGNGCGADIMELAIDLVLDSTPAPARLVVVDAINQQHVIRFYEKCNFKHSLSSAKIAKQQGRGATVKMFRDVLA